MNQQPNTGPTFRARIASARRVALITFAMLLSLVPTAHALPPTPTPTPTASGSTTPSPSPTASSTATPTPTVTPTPPRPPACAFADITTVLPSGSASLAVLDTSYRLPRGWRPAALVDLQPGKRLQPQAARAWQNMHSAAHAAGLRLALISAYRSETYQQTVFNRSAKRNGRAHALRYVARPGHSEHQLGLTVDLGTAAGVALQAEPVAHPKTRAQRTAVWLAANAAKFGWVRSYPKGMQSRTCYASEPWHWRYVGPAIAAAQQRQGTTLREFLWTQRFPTPAAAVIP